MDSYRPSVYIKTISKDIIQVMVADPGRYAVRLPINSLYDQVDKLVVLSVFTRITLQSK